MYSVLGNKDGARFISSPYPYLIIDDALPQNYYNQLNKAFPSYDKNIKVNKINAFDNKMLKNKDINYIATKKNISEINSILK